MILQIVRRCVQGSVVLLVAAVALLSLYAHYRAARSIDDPQLMAGLRGEVSTQIIHPYVEQLDDPQAFLDAYKGTVWSMRLFGVSLTDPLAAAETVAASKQIHWPLIVSILIPVAVTLLLGKVFCSWICPGYLLFEMTGKLRRLLRLAEIEPGTVRFSHANKYLVLSVGLVLAALLSAPIFALIYPPAVISRVIHAWIFGTELTAMLVLLGLIVAFEMFVSPRWWCRSMCPGGALYGMIGWLRPVRVRLARGACTGCRACIPVCEAGINPITQSESIECDNCGVCIRHCGDGALYFTIGLPKTKGRARNTETIRELLPVRTASDDWRDADNPRSKNDGNQNDRNYKNKNKNKNNDRRDADSPHSKRRRPSAVAPSVALAVFLISATTVSGHHILGLPHYSYKENYPQRPTLEYPAKTGPFDVLLTSYPGIPVPGEPANLAFYIKNRETKEVYVRPVTIRILQTSTFGDNIVVMPPTERPPFDNEHKFQFTFPADGEHIIELSMEVEGRTEVIPFLMIAGEPSASASYIFVVSFMFVIGFIVIRAIQKKRARRLVSQTAAAATVSKGIAA